MIRLLGFLSTFLLISCSSHRHISINPKPTENYFLQGKIDDYDSGIVYLGTYDTTRKGPLIILDSARIFNSYFHFKGLLAASLICKLKIDSKHVWPYSHYFVLDTGTTNVKLFKDSMANSVITANKLTEKYNAFNKKLHDLAISFDSNFSLHDKGIISTDSLNKLEKAFYGKKSELLLQQVKANPGSIVSAFIVKNNLNYEIDLPILENIYNLLTDKNNYYARSILNYLNVLLAKTKTGIGFEAPHFNITDNKNREITNETFKGKYLLIDFWASWCVGCREENPYFVNAYKKFAGKGLEMISISIDVEKQSWEDAIKKDKLSWIQACNLKGPDSNKISRDFGITLIPANFLIDKEGNIVAKDLMGKDIEKELERLLGED
ncbi:MAG: TlpA disulfide reductase family protein [Ginsengibacter sp.]